MKRPNLFLIAGPNGAGKTTTALSLLPNELQLYEFVNADEIARGLSPLNPDGANTLAGRIMIERIDALISGCTSFAFESTIGGRTWLKHVQEAKRAGYQLHLLFLYLADEHLAVTRVRERVKKGGHDVPGEAIVRRYWRGLHNLIHECLTLFDTLLIADNSGQETDDIHVIADRLNGGDLIIHDKFRYVRLMKNLYDHEN